VIADRAADQYRIAGTDLVHAKIQAPVSHTDTRGRQIQPAAFAATHHLGVAGDHLHAGIARRARQARDEAVELREFQAFFDEGIEREIQRLGPGHGQVVDVPCTAANRYRRPETRRRTVKPSVVNMISPPSIGSAASD
jgi:hypothetical protein